MLHVRTGHMILDAPLPLRPGFPIQLDTIITHLASLLAIDTHRLLFAAFDLALLALSSIVSEGKRCCEPKDGLLATMATSRLRFPRTGLSRSRHRKGKVQSGLKWFSSSHIMRVVGATIGGCTSRTVEGDPAVIHSIGESERVQQ